MNIVSTALLAEFKQALSRLPIYERYFVDGIVVKGKPLS